MFKLMIYSVNLASKNPFYSFSLNIDEQLAHFMAKPTVFYFLMYLGLHQVSATNGVTGDCSIQTARLSMMATSNELT